MNYTNKFSVLLLGAALVATSGHGVAQQKPTGAQGTTIGQAGEAIQKKLAASLKELSTLRAQIGDERLPLAEQLATLEKELAEKRNAFDEIGSELADKSQSLSNLTKELDGLRAESNYLSTLLTDYNREFETRLHVVELQRYDEQLNKTRLLLEDTTAKDGDKLASQLGIVETSLDKLDEAIGGVRFEGSAVAAGTLTPGRFVLLGPTALFASADAVDIGSVEERSRSQEPTVVPFRQDEDRDAAGSLAIGTGGSFPIDVTLGNAQKVESIDESWWEHVQKGGVIMIPMAVLAGAALLVVLFKWLAMMLVRRPSKKQMATLLECIDEKDYPAAVRCAKEMPGPAGRMLEAGANHLGEPRDLIEEVMFERMLSARLKLQGWLPFVAICATSAPLLGLLGTVTGIMGTFALMTEFGAGDPKVLSSGISEALVTTENGLIIAIPSLLLHAFLSRKARGVVDAMEKMAMQVLNRVRAPQGAGAA